MTNLRGFVIMTYARCGATYLAQLMGATGCLGRPEDWFNGEGYRNRGKDDYPLDRASQVTVVKTQGASSNGVFGLKMSSTRNDLLRGFPWASKLGPLSYIHLTRADRLARAISDVRAEQTDQYRSTTSAKQEPFFDSDMIMKAMALQANREGRMHQYFAMNGISPLEITYEEIQADRNAVIRTIAKFLAVDDNPVIAEERIELQVQRDGINEEWRRRFESENKDVDRIMPLITDQKLQLLRRLIARN